MPTLREKLADPPKNYRAVPFWSWNENLDPEELRWQVRQMARAGLGGFFMHARAGMKTEYLSEEWMDCIGACIDEGKKMNIDPWCYDENGWPSGFAGGAVPALGEMYHVQHLQIEEIFDAFNYDDPCLLNLFAVGGEPVEMRVVSRDEVHADPACRYWAVSYRTNPYYIDILNPEVVKGFIDLTHEQYHAHFPEAFDGTMKGFFTDEPQFARNKIPWSGIFREEFTKRYGYDIVQNLAAIFLNVRDAERIRYDFWGLVNHLYTTSFAGQIGAWCEAHHCKLTGHAMMEDNLFAQMNATAGVMPCYEHFHIPGIDWLGRQIANPILPKQASSVTAQLGKEHTLSETFGLCGWDVSFEELKWVADWQYVNGISLMCQHLESYSISGLRKRDYPPSLFYQQSWWEKYKFFNDYFARLSMLLTAGQPQTDVLILHPVKTAWISFSHQGIEPILALDAQFAHTVEQVAGNHYDYHFGDETLLSRYGRTEGRELILGKCRYNTVILPDMLTLDESTLNLLETFIAAGGRVIAAGRTPIYCEGRPSDRVIKLSEKFILAPTEETLKEALALSPARHISVQNEQGEIGAIAYCAREGEQQTYFLVNTDNRQGYHAAITLPNAGPVCLYNALDNTYSPLAYRIVNGETLLALDFAPMQSYLIVSGEAAVSQTPVYQIITPKNDWKIEQSDLNSLTLDTCMYAIDGGDFQGPIHTINLLALLLKRRQECDVQLKFNFNMADPVPCEQLYAVIEKADQCRITVNGTEIAYSDQGWWKDKAFKKIDIRSLVVPGANEIIVTQHFYQSPKVYHVLFGENVLDTEKNKLTYDTELESIYLIGDFGVVSEGDYSYGERKACFTDGPFKIVPRPTELKGGSFTQQGLCFFAGKMRVSQTFTADDAPALLKMGKLNAPLYQVIINGTPAGLLPWAPYEADITPYIHPGENILEVELYASNRNLLGPHHFIGGESHYVGPSTFTSSPVDWVDGDWPQGSWRDNYCFVEFGIPPAEEKDI